MKKTQKYRDFIDQMVDVCHNGQGQIKSQNVLRGIWNPNANNKYLREKSESLKEQYEVNQLLERLSETDRNIIAKILEEAFSG